MVETVNHHVLSETELREIEIVKEIVIIDTLNKEIEIVKEVKKETKIEIEMMKGDQREKEVIAVIESEQKGPVEVTGEKIGLGVNPDHQAQVINIRKVRKIKKKKVTNSISKKKLKKNRCNISILAQSSVKSVMSETDILSNRERVTAIHPLHIEYIYRRHKLKIKKP